MRIILFAAMLVIVLQACKTSAKDNTTAVGKDVIPVKLLPITGDTNSTSISASGLLTTENEARLSFKVGGVIESVLVKEGDRVRKGQLLASIKSTEVAAQVQQVQLSVEKARRDYDRVNNLYRDSVATLEQLQNARTGWEIAQQNLQQAQFNQQYSKIYAPADGFVVKKIANAGELITAGSQVLWISASSGTSKWVLRAGLSDEQWAVVNTGNKASISFDAYPGKIFKGIVSKKALAADAASGSFPIEIQVDFGNEQPANGMFGSVSIEASARSVGFSIPYEALLEANGRKGFVFVTDDRKTVKKVEVTIVKIANNVAYISSGLEGHAFLVSSGSPYLNDQSLITAN
jgi:membrane fusion protein, multidrug efflux system